MIQIISLVFLFFLLTPGILWSYPKKTNKYLIALLHAVLFAFIWHCVPGFNIKEGMEKAVKEGEEEDEAEDKDKPAPVPEPAQVPAKKGPAPNSLEFMLDSDLYDDHAVIEKIKTMEGPPEIAGNAQTFRPVTSYLLFTNQNNNTTKLDNLTKIDILDPKMNRIKEFIALRKKYPDML
jgi:hypothetical protein